MAGTNGPQILEAMDVIAASRGNVSHSQIAINWVLQRPGVSSVLLGARNEAQLLDNLGAAGWSLSDEEMQRLDAAFPPRQPYPLWVQRNIFGARNPAPDSAPASEPAMEPGAGPQNAPQDMNTPVAALPAHTAFVDSGR